MSGELAKSETAFQITADQEKLIRDTVCKGASPLELQYFLSVARRTGLDPFIGQIHSVPRRQYDENSDKWIDVRSIQVGIDGLRTVSDRSWAKSHVAKYGGETEVEYCAEGEDLVWKKVWMSKDNPYAAKAGVIRLVDLGNGQFQREIVEKIVYWEQVVQTKRDKVTPTKMWTGKKGVFQLGKCAYAAAHRAAFPQDNSGLYIEEELAAVEPPDAREQINKDIQAQDFASQLMPEVVEELKSFGFDNPAKIKNLCSEAGNTLQGLQDHIQALRIIKGMDPKSAERLRSGGYKNQREVRRLLVKYGSDMTKVIKFLDGEPVEAEVVE